MQYRWMDRHIGHWNRVESSEIDLLIFGQLIFNNSAKTIWWQKDRLFNKWFRKRTLTHTSYHIQKINSKWIINLNLKAKTDLWCLLKSCIKFTHTCIHKAMFLGRLFSEVFVYDFCSIVTLKQQLSFYHTS